MTKKDLEVLKEKLDMLDGNPPHDVPENILIGDPEYVEYIEILAGVNIDEVRRLVENI